MLLHRTLVVAAVMSALTFSCTANAQGLLGHAKNDNSDFSSLYDPLCDLDTCWFDPISCDCPDERPLNSGWFFGYSRMTLNVARPHDQPISRSLDLGVLSTSPGAATTDPLNSTIRGNSMGDQDGDWAWGNRFDFGWTSEDGTSLWFVVRKLDDPNRRINFDNIDLNNDALVRPDGEDVGPTFAVLNGLNMYGIEINKMWRLEPTPRGTVIEPFVGPRYVRLRDHGDRTDFFTNFNTLDFADGVPNTTVNRRLSTVYRQEVVTTDNDLFGGQLGMRSRWRRGRWQITSDVRALAFWNHQNREILADNEIQQRPLQATFDATGALTGVAFTAPTIQSQVQDNIYDSSDTFVYGGELNLLTSFDITNGFAITAGAEIIAFADGVGRGYTGTDDSLVLAGFTFGFTFNR